MIYPPCADAADTFPAGLELALTNMARADHDLPPLENGHPAEICRDFGRPGCGCQHGQTHQTREAQPA